MNDLISRRAALEKVRSMQTYKLFMGDDMILIDKADVQTELMMLPTIQPEKVAPSPQGTTSDLISRQAAIDALGKLHKEDIEDYGCEIPEGFNQDNLDRAIFAIKQLPTVQPEVLACGNGELVAKPEPHWILCSEKMPEEHEWLGTKKFGTTISDEVYATFENEKGERFCMHLSFQNGELSSYDQFHMDTWYKGSKPIAWMPLPKPFEGGIK